VTSAPGPSSDWRPLAARSTLQARARLYAGVRRFFAEAGVLEVETPIASAAGTTDPALASLATSWCGGGARRPLWLQTSPEHAMKRLLAGGAGPVFQICKVFRDGERGRLHHPEFSLLEWYRPGWDQRRLMSEVAALVRCVLGQPEMPLETLTYRDLFLSRLGLDPFRARTDELRECARAAGLAGVEGLGLDRDGWLDLLLTHRIEAGLGRGCVTFVHDYPASQAALARVRPDPEPVAERFEVYLEGLELANGFRELTDAREQRRRFERDLARRAATGRGAPPLDERFLAALEAGMPEASGVALGLDRLLMVITASSHIDQVLAFPVERA
jgi:lysyl-tRNA synthetase class 2